MVEEVGAPAEEESSLQPVRSRAKTVALAAMAAVVLLTQRDASGPGNTPLPLWLTGSDMFWIEAVSYPGLIASRCAQ